MIVENEAQAESGLAAVFRQPCVNIGIRQASIGGIHLAGRLSFIGRPLCVRELLGLSPSLALLVAGEPREEAGYGRADRADCAQHLMPRRPCGAVRQVREWVKTTPAPGHGQKQ